MKTFDEFVAESFANWPIVLVRVEAPAGKQFLYAFPVSGSSEFAKDGQGANTYVKEPKGKLTMIHLDRTKDCWRIMMGDNGNLRCAKAMWPKNLDGRHIVLNDSKTPLHWHSLGYTDPFKFVRDFQEVLLKEKNIEWK